MGQLSALLVPDIGDFQDVPVVELLVKVGDMLTRDTAVVTLESDKASMEVPAEVEGVVAEILVAEGDRVSAGSLLLRYSDTATNGVAVSDRLVEPAATHDTVMEIREMSPPPVIDETPVVTAGKSGPAAPSVRRLARELGVVLADVPGSGAKGRLSKEDIRAYVKKRMQSGADQKESAGKHPEVHIDFSAFGPVEKLPLSRIQKISGAQLARNWAAIPHVTSFDEADITELDQFRRQLNLERPVKLSLLSFILKAVQYALQAFPQLNSSLQGEELVVKKYYHIGFAVDTPGGLLVPVVRNVDMKGVAQISAEMAELVELARKGKLKREQMEGGTFTISSLGNIGTTHFTPIINAPEVAILGLGKGAIRPFWDGGQFVPRLILPLSLSWDHRAMDGVTASRFNAHLCRVLEDFRRAVL